MTKDQFKQYMKHHWFEWTMLMFFVLILLSSVGLKLVLIITGVTLVITVISYLVWCGIEYIKRRLTRTVEDTIDG